MDIQKPDVETRIAILKSKLTQAKLKVADSILELLASSIDTNVRELEGALNKLIAYHEHSKMEITLDLAKSLLRDVIPPEK